MTKISSPQIQNTQKDPKFRNKGFIRGQLAGSLASTALVFPSVATLGFMKKVSKLDKTDLIELKRASGKGLADSGLKAKGVRLTELTETSFRKILKDISSGKNPVIWNKKDKKALRAIREEIANSKRFKRMCKMLKKYDIDSSTMLDSASKIQSLHFKLGMNACFLPKANKIVTPSKTLKTSIFHEMGHALNANGNPILKGLQKCRPAAMIIPGIVLAMSLLNKHKVGEEKSQNKVKGTLDTIKDNAGKITAIAMAPMVVEEAIASLRGGKIAKNLVKSGDLSKNILKKVRLTNLGGLSSYALALVGTVFATKVAISAKDKIQANYETKKINKQIAKQNKLDAKKYPVN